MSVSVQDRPTNTKPFAFHDSQIQGATNVETLDKHPDFKQARQLHNLCITYATSYSMIMLKRLKKEKPDFFAENDLDEKELTVSLTHNMCLPYTKYKSRVFRDATSKIIDKNHLTEDIRRLYNGGDRFHPYF